MTDIILQSFGLSESIKRSEVSEPSLSDHRNILFNLEGFVPECLFRNSRGYNCDLLREDLKGRLEQGLEMNMKDDVGLGLAILFVQMELVLAYEGNYSIRPVKTAKCPLSGHQI